MIFSRNVHSITNNYELSIPGVPERAVAVALEEGHKEAEPGKQHDVDVHYHCNKRNMKIKYLKFVYENLE